MLCEVLLVERCRFGRGSASTAGLCGKETEISLTLELVVSSLCCPRGVVQDCLLQHLF